jgi:N-acetylmuramoyl-L-alanine amidase
LPDLRLLAGKRRSGRGLPKRLHRDTVKQIQTRLRNWGYYSGEVDGIYGSKTVEAVKYFQRKNGLSVDGITGPKTLAALGIRVSSSSTAAVSLSNDASMLARIISAEGGESLT